MKATHRCTGRQHFRSGKDPLSWAQGRWRLGEDASCLVAILLSNLLTCSGSSLSCHQFSKPFFSRGGGRFQSSPSTNCPRFVLRGRAEYTSSHLCNETSGTSCTCEMPEERARLHVMEPKEKMPGPRGRGAREESHPTGYLSCPAHSPGSLLGPAAVPCPCFMHPNITHTGGFPASPLLLLTSGTLPCCPLCLKSCERQLMLANFTFVWDFPHYLGSGGDSTDVEGLEVPRPCFLSAFWGDHRPHRETTARHTPEEGGPGAAWPSMAWKQRRASHPKKPWTQGQLRVPLGVPSSSGLCLGAPSHGRLPSLSTLEQSYPACLTFSRCFLFPYYYIYII